jgi:pyruvate dehydrogenase E1 component alpha subunit
LAIAPPHTQLLAMYEQMLLIRVFETEAERQYKAAKIGGYCHLSSGQEATCVGVIDAMQDDDLLVTGYRSHGFALARGTSPEAVMAELFGRRDGCAHGRGGSMHLLDTDRGYYGGWGIVGGQLPLATGLALALVRQGKPQAVVCELGDGAVNMGAWHESLNLAALWRLPIVYLIVNNKYGMGTSVERASAEPDLYKRASAFRMHGEPVDGDDLEAVVEATTRLLANAREQREPSVLEAITYRYRGHSVADAGLAYRTRDEIAERQERDPLLRTAARLRECGASTDELRAIDERVEERVREAVEFASDSPEPDVDALAWAMYSQGSDEQFARMRPGSPFGEQELVFEGGLGK